MASSCAGDAALCREVEELLKFAGPDDSFLHLPVTTDIGSSQHDLLVGQTIGCYTIKELIASGGMGSVYLAEQESPRRTVAIKVMTMGYWSESAMRRFSHESHILGRLQHPNIAQVFEAGVLTPSLKDRDSTGMSDAHTARPIPFFAMEYVSDAMPITVHAGRYDCGIEERLRLLLQACDAVAYGHQRGVIHRDLKPANILVGSEVLQDSGSSPQAPGPKPQTFVKLIDFGVARCTDSDVAATTMHTDAGQLIGTLAYMSPEQCDGDALNIDTRADVYALGVVLYELICGRLPYDVSKTSIAAAARTICETAPMPLTEVIHVRRRIAGRPARDIEAIVLRALEKCPAKRYGGAADLARDLRRWLNREPIDARPLTRWDRMIQWVGKHPKTATAFACLAIVFSIAIGSIIAARSIYYEPNHIELDGVENDGWYAARLENLLGETLHTWPTDASAEYTTIATAELVDFPDVLGKKKAAYIGYSGRGTHSLVGRLCAYDTSSSLDEPWRSVQLSDDDLPADVRAKGRHGIDCSVKAMLVADVFPDRPGNELVVSHLLGIYSQYAIRIYDLELNLLYQVWQDGGAKSFCWLPDAGLLVCLGADERFKAGIAPFFKLKQTEVVFALRPEVGSISNEYIQTQARGLAINPVWFKYIHPMTPNDDAWTIKLHHGPRAGRRDANVFELSFMWPSAGFAIVVDRNGNEFPASRHFSDMYESLLETNTQIPRNNKFFLSDEPPGTITD